MTGTMEASAMAATATVPLVGKKYMNKLGGMVNESAASAMSAFARKQMEKMGWTEGKGLGKDEQGMTTYVRVKKREESMGVGVETLKIEEQQNQWWYNVYDKLADKIKVAADSDDDDNAGKKDKKSKKSKKKKSKKKGSKRPREESDRDSSEDDEAPTAAIAKAKKFRVPTDDELFAATGGKLFGRRAYGSCLGKLKRDELHVKAQLGGAKKGEVAETTSSSASSENDDDATPESSGTETKVKKAKKQKKKKSKASKKQKTEDDE